MKTEHVLVTGLGMVTPCGRGVRQTWDALLAGESGIGPIERFDLFGAATRVGGSVPGFERESPHGSLAEIFALEAATEALAQAGLAHAPIDLAVVANHGERRGPSAEGDALIVGASELADRIGERVSASRTTAIYGACAAGGIALCIGAQAIRSGRADRVVAGGTDALLRDFDFFQFANLYAMSTRECPPEEACCPFDTRRDGFVLSEGAAFVVLESARSVDMRGGSTLAQLRGFGMSQNAYHMVASPPDAEGPYRAMTAAMRSGEVEPHRIGYINAHGTSTRDNDWCETHAIHRAFEDAAPSVAVSSTKSQMGHLMAAAGAAEVVVSVMSLRQQVAPPTINLCTVDPHCDLNHVAGDPRDLETRFALSNSFGFGGHNTSILLERSN